MNILQLKKVLYVALLVLLLSMVGMTKMMAQTPYRQYADNGVLLNFHRIDNVDFRVYLMYKLAQDNRFALVPEDENGVFTLNASDDMSREDFFDTFEDFYNSVFTDFQLLSKTDISDLYPVWKSQVDPRLFASITMDIALRNTRGSNNHCIDAVFFCTTYIFDFEAATTYQTADDLEGHTIEDGCIYISYSPSWYCLRIDEPGPFSIHIEGHDPDNASTLRDVDFCIWGPYTEEEMNSDYACTHLTSNKIIDCSYSASFTEDVYMGFPDDQHVHNTNHGTVNYHVPQSGEYYLLMITNYSRQPCVINFHKNEDSGSGTTDCSILPSGVSNDGPYCVGDIINLHAIGVDGATYSWTGPDNFSSTRKNPRLANCTMAMAGTYTCTITLNGQTDTDSTVVEVFPTSIASFTVDNECVGKSAHFTSTSATNPTGYDISEYQWDFGDGQTSSVASPYHTYAQTGTYQVTLTVSGEGSCSDEITQTVFVNDYDWTVNPNQYPNNMTAIAVIQVNGVEQMSSTLEVGAFCGNECRGRETPVYISQLNRYIVFLTMYGSDGDQLTFRLYNHVLDAEFNGISVNTLVFSTNTMSGSPDSPYVIEFEAPSYTISASVNPSSSGAVSGVGTYYEDSICTLTATPNEDYTFMYWMENGNQVSTSAEYSFTVTSDRNLVAQFTPPLTITATTNPIGSGTIIGAGEYDYGTTCTLTATPNEDYYFVKWTKNDEVVSIQTSYNFVVTNDANYVAHFNLKPVVRVTAMYDPDPDDNQSPNVRVCWSMDYSNSIQEDFESGDFTRYAWEFSDNYSWLITDYNPYEGNFCMRSNNGGVNNSTASAQVTVNIPDDVQISFYSRISSESSFDFGRFYIDGQEMGKWSGNGSWEEHSYDITVGEHTFKWAYTKDSSVNSNEDCFYVDNISFWSNLSKGGDRAVNHYQVYRSEYPENGSWELIADNVTDTSFVDTGWGALTEGWYKYGVVANYAGDGGTTMSTSYMVRSNKILRAYLHTITATVNPAEGGTVTGTGEYTYGTTCTLTATANEGYNFMCWTKNGSQVSTNLSYSFTVTVNEDYVAVFVPMPEGQYLGDGGTATDKYLPSYYNRKYTLSQQIYTADEIGMAGLISSVSFFNGGAEKTRIYDVYMVHTDKTAFENNTDWIAVTEADRVFSGTVTMAANNWTTLLLDIAFAYNGTSNLALIVDDNSGNWTNAPHMQCRVYDANGNQAIRVYSDNTNYDPFNPSGYGGTLHSVKNQIVLGFLSTRHFVTAGNWSTASNWQDGAMPRTFDEAFIDAPCQLDQDATVFALTVSDGQSLTLQSGKTLIVTNTLTNTATTGLVIEDGAQLEHASENVSAMVKKNIAGYGTNNGKFHLISNPLASTINPELASIYHLTRGNYDLYDWLATAPDHLEWRNFKDDSFMMYAEGNGYLYANQNGMELNFPGTLLPSKYRFGKTVSYDVNDTEHPGWNLIGNPFMCNAYLVNANNQPLPFYRMNDAGNDFEAVSSGAIAPMEGVFYQASENGTVYFIRTDNTSQIPTYTISVTASSIGGGTVSGGGTYRQGQSCTVTATANEGYSFAHWTENGSVISTNANYTFTVNANRTLVANFTYNGGGTHEYVDLGLPSGTLWATCNVGADTPEDYGHYFAWGETQPKDTYNWNTYQYCMGSNNTLTKYCNNSSYGYNGFTDNLTTLLPEDDAATANWGNGWRMPTKEEWQELYQNTTHTWTTQNGVNGRLFTASNGNSLFLPAAGYRLDGSLGYAGSLGDYWSSSLYTGYPYYAWGLNFNSVDSGMDYSYRDYGWSVRAVRSSRQNKPLFRYGQR